MSDQSVKAKMENLFKETCGSWENCTEDSIQSLSSTMPGK